jgi:hypothetical protein
MFEIIIKFVVLIGSFEFLTSFDIEKIINIIFK